MRSPGGDDAYRLYYTSTLIRRADGAGYVGFAWTQPAFESDEFEQRAWEPRRGWLVDALEVRPIDAATFTWEGRAFVLGHRDTIEVRAVDTGRLLARAALPTWPEHIYALPADRFVVGLHGGASASSRPRPSKDSQLAALRHCSGSALAPASCTLPPGKCQLQCIHAW